MNNINKKMLKYMDFLLIIVAIVWGLNYVIVKVSIVEMNSLIFNTIRYIVGSITCWVIMLLRREDFKINRDEFRKLIILSIIHILNQLTFVFGLKYTSAGTSSIILASTPMWVAIISYILKIEKINKNIWTGITISFIGCILVITRLDYNFSIINNSYIGNILVLFATIFWSLYTICVKKFFQNISIIKITAYSMTFSGILFFIISSKTIISTTWLEFSLQAWLGAILSGILVFGISYILWNIGVRIVGATRTSVYANLPPFVSILFGWIILHEGITIIQIVGGIFILFGLNYVNKKSCNNYLKTK